MNKIKIFSLAALCLGFVACDEVEESFSKPQTNPQEAMFADTDITVTTPQGGNFNLQTLNANNEQAKVSAYTVTNVPTGYAIKLVAELSTDEAFTTTYDVDTELDSLGNVTISPDAIQGVYYANVTHNPVPDTFYLRYKANAVYGTETVRIGGPDKYYGEGKIDFTPYDPANVIETEYYLAGTASDGTITNAIKLNHSDINQYDDPVFSVSYEITDEQAAAGFKWYIVPKSTYTAGTLSGDNTAFGPAEPTALNGTLTGEFTDGAPATGVISDAGPHLFTFNMAERTYDVALALEAIWAYTSSPANGFMLTSNDYTTYNGFVGMRQAFFCLCNVNNNSANLRWGQALDADGKPIEGKIAPQDVSDLTTIAVDQPGCYFINVNLATLSYTATYIEYFGLIGDFNNWEGDVKMTATDRYHMVWTAEATLADGQQLKIRTNGSWDDPNPNLGAPYGDTSNISQLVEHGENIVWNLGDGTFTLTLDLTTVPYHLTAVKK